MDTFQLRNGIFLAPFHPLDEDPTEAIHRDLALIEHLDGLGYEEAWIGEQHAEEQAAKQAPPEPPSQRAGRRGG